MAVSDPWIECFFVGALQMRCSVVTDRSTGDTVIIDGGSEPERLLLGLTVLRGGVLIGQTVQTVP